jgi:hypothetical protein
MFTELWKSLGGSFDKRWLRNLFIPALVFWGAGLWIWAQVTGVEQALKTWKGYSTEEQIFLGAAGLLIVFFTTILLEAFEGPLLRLYEGYWLYWTGLAERRKENLEEKLQRRRELRAQVAAGQATLKERAELSRLDTELAHRPWRSPERSMPTRLGDILRTAEDYARDRYGLDPIVLWPRLFPHLGESLREALGATQEQLDLALRLATLSVLYGVAWSVVVAVNRAWPVLWWTLPALVIAWLLWRSAHQIAIGYAGLLRSAFDLHRFDVYDDLHWPKPTSPETEKVHGTELTLYLLEGTGAKDIAYTHEGEDTASESEGAADQDAPRSVWDWVGRTLGGR